MEQRQTFGYSGSDGFYQTVQLQPGSLMDSCTPGIRPPHWYDWYQMIPNYRLRGRRLSFYQWGILVVLMWKALLVWFPGCWLESGIPCLPTPPVELAVGGGMISFGKPLLRMVLSLFFFFFFFFIKRAILEMHFHLLNSDPTSFLPAFPPEWQGLEQGWSILYWNGGSMFQKLLTYCMAFARSSLLASF